MNFGDKVFKWFLFLLAVLFVLTSYYRFLVIHDYLVAYEGECDPYTQVCFVGCEDDECSSEYYYSQVEKYAPNVYEQCGKDITDCESASRCLPEDGEQCSVTYCDPGTDGDECETFTEEDVEVPEDDGATVEGEAFSDGLINASEL